jgi:outer membrane receptor protein involved in Fe transport
VLTVTFTLAATTAVAQMTSHFNLPAQPLADSLRAVAGQTHSNILFDRRVIAPFAAKPLNAELSVDEALTQLLAGTGLTWRATDSKTVMIVPEEGADTQRPGEISALDATRPADTAESSPWDARSGAGQSNDASGLALEEVVVTAQKREERLRDVPVPVTAIGTASLLERQQLRLQDYYNRIPGVSLTLVGDGGTPQITIRGVTTGGINNPTVASVIDDVPVGASSVGQGAFDVPDLDPSDVSRIEVLRGPQGVLYGASSLGGLIKYVTVDPLIDAFGGHLQAGASSVHKGKDLGYNVGGSVNVPVGERFALRASAFTREEPGYIDRPGAGERDINTVDASGGRLAALWRVSDDLSLKFSALKQDIAVHGSPSVTQAAGFGDLEVSGQLAGTGGHDKEFDAYSATLTARLGSAELTSLTGYGTNRIATHADVSFIGALFAPVFGSGHAISHLRYETSKLSQELRLSVPIGARVEWLLGGFYTRERTDIDQIVPVVNPTLPVTNPITGEPVTDLLQTHQVAKFEERAAFSAVTFKVTDRFDVQLGGRLSRNDVEDGAQRFGGPFYLLVGGPSFSGVTPGARSSDSPFTYLVTPRFKVSPDLMVYARMASGYRSGGPNGNQQLLGANGLPQSYDADTTENYEMGVKGSLFERTVSFDASLYYIDWKDVQISVRHPRVLATYRLNGTRAKSQGVELSADVRPWRGLTVSGWFAWNDAKLTRDLPPGDEGTAVASAGDRLPISSRFSGSLSLDQAFPLGNTVSGFAGASVNYVGQREDVFVAKPPRRSLPSYTQLDLNAGAHFNTWRVTASVTNVADTRGELQRDALNTALVIYSRPRTFAVSIAKDF